MLHIRLRIRMIVVVVAARNGTVGNGTGGTVAGGGLYNNAASVISSIAAFSGQEDILKTLDLWKIMGHTSKRAA